MGSFDGRCSRCEKDTTIRYDYVCDNCDDCFCEDCVDKIYECEICGSRLCDTCDACECEVRSKNSNSVEGSVIVTR